MLKRTALALCVALCGFLAVSSLQGCATTKAAPGYVSGGPMMMLQECSTDVQKDCMRQNPGASAEDCRNAAEQACIAAFCDQFLGSPQGSPESCRLRQSLR